MSASEARSLIRRWPVRGCKTIIILSAGYAGHFPSANHLINFVLHVTAISNSTKTSGSVLTRGSIIILSVNCNRDSYATSPVYEGLSFSSCTTISHFISHSQAAAAAAGLWIGSAFPTGSVAWQVNRQLDQNHSTPFISRCRWHAQFWLRG